MNPVLRIAGLEIPAYRTLTILALVIGAAVAATLLARRGVRGRTAVAVAVVAATIGGGMVGARVFAAFTVVDPFWNDPAQLLALRTGSMAIYGGLGGAALAGLAAARIARMPVLRVADCAAPAIGVGIAILRIGCLFAGCAFGKVTSVPWGITYPWGSDAHLTQIDGTVASLFRAVPPVHPVPLYEIAATLLLAALGYAALRRSYRDGTVLAIVVGGYSLARLLIHPVRMVPEGGTPAWFDPAMYAAVLGGVLVWTVAPRLRAALTLRPRERWLSRQQCRSVST